MAKIRYRSPELMQKRRRMLKILMALFAVCIILLTTGIVFFLRMERFQIREISISGARIIEESSIRKMTNDSLVGSYIYVVPKANTFIYSVTTLKEKMLSAYPGIASLDIHREGFTKIAINITERKPHDLWCGESGEMDAPDCYFIDDTGLVFAKAPYFSGDVYFVYRGKLDKDSPLGARVLDPERFSSFEKFIASLKGALHVDVVGVDLKDLGDFDLLLSSGARVMMNQNISYDDMFQNFGSLMKSGQFATSTLANLDYIDMRFGNKIFFKQKTVQK